MRFHFTEEQEQFRDMLRRFLASASPATEVRRLMATDAGYDPTTWKRLASDLGLTALNIPETYGGGGFGAVESCIAMEEMGRTLLCAPYLASVVAARAIAHIASEQQRSQLLPLIASGESIATLALAERVGGFDLAAIELVARPVDEGFVLTGEKCYVIDGCVADMILVVARLPETRGLDGLSLFLVRKDAKGLTRRALTVIDPTRKLAAFELRDVPAEALGTPGTVAAALEGVLDFANVLLANEMVGGAARLLEDTIAFTKTRVQFGRAIGSFQAIKHRCADMLVNVELAKSAAYYAAEAIDDGSADTAYLSSLAKACAAEAYLQTAIDAIQLHGGIGFTFEQDTHLWFKRAKSSEVLFGDAAWHRERMIRHLPEKQRQRAEQQS